MRLLHGLSGRLLILTVIVVMAVEVVIFVPSVARFRADYLEERVARAQLAALAVMAAPDNMVTPEMERTLLAGAGVRNVVLVAGGARALLLQSGPIDRVAASFDLRTMGAADQIGAALSRLAAPGRGEVIRVIGAVPGRETEALEITLDADPLSEAMIDYGWRILKLSLVISAVAAVVVFLAIRRVVVAPLLRLTEGVRRFQEDPEDEERIMRPSGHTGEVAEAEAAIAAMQAEVRRALAQKARLASLGAALAKISHDLRNMLSAQQLMVDRLEGSRDPVVARVAPKMVGALDRAIRLCQRTLDYGRAEEAPPERRPVALGALVTEVAETLGIVGPEASVRLVCEVADEHTVPADPEQLYRVLANLMRNAVEAIQAASRETGQPGEIRVSAETRGAWAVVRLADTGPGLPERARAHLFQPFRGSARRGGTGLGLSIAAELVAAHGGRLDLVSSGREGTVFEIRLPLTAAAADTRAA